MLKQYTNSNWLKELKRNLVLSDIQRDVLIGTILGDGYLRVSRSGKTARLQICHSIASTEYVLWKRQIFSNWVYEEPKRQLANNSLRFTTISHELFFEYFKTFYKKGTKLIPKSINNFLKSPLSLAVWFMDDGNGYLKNSAFRISTYAFGLEGNHLLKNCLNENFELDVSIFKDKKGWQIYIPLKNGNALRFKNLIKPYILQSMNYKIESRSPVETKMEGTR